MTAGPAASDLADSAVTIASNALEELQTRAATADTALFHEAWRVLRSAQREAPRSIRDDQRWIRQVAMELLLCLSASSSSSSSAASGDVEDEDQDDTSIDIGGLWRALADGRLNEAERAATSALDSLPPTTHWQRGNVIHHAHLVLGYVRLRSGDVAGATEHLLAAGQTPGSPQLNSFGPNMSLALALLQQGSSEAVLRYFDECAQFWGKLPQWRAQVQAGEVPNFGANLAYGIPDDVEVAI